MMRKKLTDREKDMIARLHERLIPLVSLESWAWKTSQKISKIRSDNNDVGGPDLRNKDMTKQMQSLWESGQTHLGQSSKRFSDLSRELKKKINNIMKQGKKIDPSFDPTSPY